MLVFGHSLSIFSLTKLLILCYFFLWPDKPEFDSQTLINRPQTVITGFNTDIEFNGVTYHVQTEDKGLSRPIILSLVYDRGTILASKRSPYDDLLANGFDETALSERLQKQHRLICAAIQAGRIEDLKKLSSKQETQEIVSDRGKQPKNKKQARENANDQNSEEAHSEQISAGDAEYSIPRPDLNSEPLPEPTHGPLVDVISIIDEPSLIPQEAVAIVSDLAGKDRPTNNRLSIDLLGDPDLKGGQTKTITMMISRGSGRKIVAGAEVMVKIIGSAFRPLIFHSSTDKNGLAHVTLQFPKFKSGRAAFLVRAMSDGEEVELRRPIVHG